MELVALPREFFAGAPLAVARSLLGQRIARRLDGELLVGRIVEVEAYGGQEDSTSHAYRGPRGRALGMFGAVGSAYVYLIYGMHNCLNVVAHTEGSAGAVLIRALAPEISLERMRALRGGVAPHLISSGPGRLSQALSITRELNGIDLCDPLATLFLAAGAPVADTLIAAGPRIGVRGRPEDTVWSWRLYVADDPNVSPGRRDR